MIDLILSIDKTIFIFINNNLSNPIFDVIMPIFDNTKNLIPLMLLPYILAIIFDKNNRYILLILIPIAILLTDQSGLFLKKTILRPRPWVTLDANQIIHLVSEKGANYSFPSNHAANMSSLAIIFSFIYTKLKPIFWSIAGIVIFSRVYIGVHYPIDVIVGTIIGSLYGIFLINSWRILKNKLSD
tara:strand:+ start:172 stop:726 length:555 start_codon:yes stop_codon:yes gene_type:complete